jgi:phosphatidylglycerophosphate synthase
MKSIANYISIARILLVLALVRIEPLSTMFYVIYFICGISDILDGFIARKTNTTSKFGEKLDSAADLIMVVVLIAILYPIINPTVQILFWIVIIGIIRAVSVVVVILKYKTFGIIHTYANKITGLILFAFPVLLVVFPLDMLMYGICIVASISAVEELLINLLSNELCANKKSIFMK